MKTEAQLYVTDMDAALAYYAQRLGFACAFVHGDPPFYAQVERAGAALNLRHVDHAVIDPARREAEALLSATIALDDAASLFREFQQAGATFAQELRTEPWGACTFIVRDPDGNLLLFAGRVT